jgi:phage shock protein E
MRQSIKLWLALIVLASALSGCKGASQSAPAAEVDIANLPNTIDVSTTKALQGRADVALFDVREQAEYDAGHIPGVKLIPLGQVPARMAEIPKDKAVILTCRSGNRSGQAADFLRQQGYTNVHNMEGGIVAWQQAGLPVEK